MNKLKRLTTIDMLQIQTDKKESQRYPMDLSIALYYRHSDNTAMQTQSLPNAKVVIR